MGHHRRWPGDTEWGPPILNKTMRATLNENIPGHFGARTMVAYHRVRCSWMFLDVSVLCWHSSMLSLIALVSILPVNARENPILNMGIG